MARRQSSPFIVQTQEAGIVRSQKTPSHKKRSKSQPKWPTLTLQQAFEYDLMIERGENNSLNKDLLLERQLRSLGCLIHSISDCGNYDLPGAAAEGFASVLDRLADQLGSWANRNPNPNTMSKR